MPYILYDNLQYHLQPRDIFHSKGRVSMGAIAQNAVLAEGKHPKSLGYCSIKMQYIS